MKKKICTKKSIFVYLYIYELKEKLLKQRKFRINRLNKNGKYIIFFKNQIKIFKAHKSKKESK